MQVTESIHIPPGEIRTIICYDIRDSVTILGEGLYNARPERCTVMLEVDAIPTLDDLLDRMLNSLAEIALALWPDWYEGALAFSEKESDCLSAVLHQSLALKLLAGSRQEILTRWLKASIRMCRKGRLPLPSGFSKTVNARQLALAIYPRDLLVAIACKDESPPPDRLRGLTRAAEWLASETKASIAVLVSAKLEYHKELDPILYHAILIGRSCSEQATKEDVEESKHIVWPLYGKPHPFSPGEQELARRLELDSELRGLFRFNHTVRTITQSDYLVDLLWPEGMIVVEVDGFKHHGNRFAFSADRHRDYELVISGYAVLRLPHDEVIRDGELALEKIRSLVKFRREQFLSHQGEFHEL